MSEHAPDAYAPPRAPVELPTDRRTTGDDSLVGLPIEAHLPAVCAKCGQTEGVQAPPQWLSCVPRTQALMLTGLLGVGVALMYRRAEWKEWWTSLYALALAVRPLTRKRARLLIPLCSVCGVYWRRARIVSAVALAANFAWFPLSLWSRKLRGLFNIGVPDALWAVSFPLAMFGSGLIVTRADQFLLQTKKIDATHAWVTGLHPAAVTAYVGNERSLIEPTPSLTRIRLVALSVAGILAVVALFAVVALYLATRH